MKKLAVVILLLNSTLVYSQNIIKISRSLRNLRYTNITRTIHTNIPRGFVALDIAKYQALNAHTNWNFTNTSTSIDVIITRKLAAQTLKSPRTIYGPYNYVRTFSKISKDESLTTGRHLEDWRHINNSQGYNGAHHLINKYTLKIIWENQRKNGIKTNLDDMQKNAPAIFHPLHGDKRFQYIFHNPVAQIDDYNMYGMKMVILDLLNQIDEAGISIGLPRMNEDYILGILKEAELWCKTYQLVWEKDIILLQDYELPEFVIEPKNLFKDTIGNFEY